MTSVFFLAQRPADGDIESFSSYRPNALYTAGNTLVSLVDRFVPETLSIQAAEASVSSLTLFNGGKKGVNMHNIFNHNA
jgi:hypothetical protein